MHGLLADRKLGGVEADLVCPLFHKLFLWLGSG